MVSSSYLFLFLVLGVFFYVANAQDDSVMSRALDDQCNYDDHCGVTNSYCNQEQHRCVCRDGFIRTTDRAGCYAGVGAKCNIKGDIECAPLENSECKQGICTCKITHVPDPVTFKCVSGALLKEACVSTQHCLLGVGNYSECLGGVCQCATGYRADPTKCIKMKGLSEECKDTKECLGTDNVQSQLCENGRCVCAAGFVENDERKCQSGSTQVLASMFTLFVLTVFAKLII